MKKPKDCCCIYYNGGCRGVGCGVIRVVVGDFGEGVGNGVGGL